MERSDWQRAKHLFNQAVELAASERQVWLARECGGDATMRAAVEQMLAADAAENRLLDQPVLYWQPEPNPMDQREATDHEPAIYLGKYRLLRKLGEGGMGEVFLALDEKLNRQVALKRLLQKTQLSPQLQGRFDDEMRALAQLNARNIIRIYDSGEAEGLPFFVMEYVAGESLKSRLERGALPHAEALAIVQQLAQGLGAAHDRQIIHRDMKPENILLGRDADGLLVKILDFGIAVFKESATHTRTDMVVGTAAYLSPEQAQAVPRERLTPAVDLYALGLLAYEMFTGARVFTATHPQAYLHMHVNETPVPPSSRNPAAGLTPALDEVILSALQKDPLVRGCDVRRFAQRLTDAVGVQARVASLPTVIEPDPLTTNPLGAPPKSCGAGSQPAPQLERAQTGQVENLPHSFSLFQGETTLEKKPPTPPRNYLLLLAAALLLALGGGWFAWRQWSRPAASISQVTPGLPVKPKPSASPPSVPSSVPVGPPAIQAAVFDQLVALALLRVPGNQAISFERVFKQGDQVRLAITPKQTGHFYLVQQGTNGKLDILYPYRQDAASYAEKTADRQFVFPAKLAWEFDGRVGTETLYAVFVTKLHQEPALVGLENGALEQKTITALQALAAGQYKSASVAVRKIELRHGK